MFEQHLIPPGASFADLAKMLVPANAIAEAEAPTNPCADVCLESNDLPGSSRELWASTGPWICAGRTNADDTWGILAPWRATREEAEADLLVQSEEGWFELAVFAKGEIDDPAGERALTITGEEIAARAKNAVVSKQLVDRYIAEDIDPAYIVTDEPVYLDEFAGDVPYCPPFEGDPADCAFNAKPVAKWIEDVANSKDMVHMESRYAPASGCPMDRVKTWTVGQWVGDRIEPFACGSIWFDSREEACKFLSRVKFHGEYFPIVKEWK